MAAHSAIYPTHQAPLIGDLVGVNGNVQPAEFYERTSVHVEPGEFTDEESILAQPEDYKPLSLRELVRSTPAELISRTSQELDPRPKKMHMGRTIDPMPPEVQWFMMAKLESDILYTFIKDVVHRELEKFAERIDEHYVLVPRR